MSDETKPFAETRPTVYLVNGRWVDGNGEPVKAPASEKPAKVAPKSEPQLGGDTAPTTDNDKK